MNHVDSSNQKKTPRLPSINKSHSEPRSSRANVRGAESLNVRAIQIRPCQRLPSPPVAEDDCGHDLKTLSGTADQSLESKRAHATIPSPVSPLMVLKPVPPTRRHRKERESFIPFTAFIGAPERLQLLAPHMSACLAGNSKLDKTPWFQSQNRKLYHADRCSFFDRYCLISQIGKGNNVVYKVFDFFKGKHYAAKVVKHNGDPELLSYIRREFAYGREAYCSCVVDYVHYYIGTTQDVLVQELCPRGDLLGYIRQCVSARAVVPEAYVWTTLAQLAYAVFSCHSNGIVHADLKPQNVFLTNSGVKLGDFGLSNRFCRNIDENMHLLSKTASRGKSATGVFTLQGPAGTEDYEAPELLQKHRFDHSIDIWGFGCIAYELAACQPFCTLPRSIISSPTFAWVRYVENKLLVVKQRGYSGCLVQLISECLSPDPQKRPKTRDLYSCCNFMQQKALEQLNLA